MFFYEDTERIRKINRVFNDPVFLKECGYEINRIPERLRELILPVKSPMILIEDSYETVLDIGCGAGSDLIFLSEKLSPRLICGIDLSFNLLREGKKVHDKDLVRADGLKIPFKDKIFNLVVLNGAFNQFLDKQGLLEEIKRILKKQGSVFLADLFRKKEEESLLEWGSEFNTGYALRLGEIYELFADNGFFAEKEIIEEDYTDLFGVCAILWKVL